MGSSIVELNPNPAALVESLRAFPYSPSSAIADLIDNSITAKARVIRINGHWNNGNPTIEVIDNGKGMDMECLQEALRFAGEGPGATRDLSDLGRFGLGLKTASLSQCSRMTVTTVNNEVTSNLGWDVDELRNNGGLWIPVKSSDEVIQEHRRQLYAAPGTVVRWQKLDRLLGPNTESHSSDDLDLVLEGIAKHLEMVFHRFMQQKHSDGKPQLTIVVNETELIPWDPFLSAYPIKDQVWKIENQCVDLPSGVSTVTGFVLPTEREAVEDDCLDLWKSTGRGEWNQLQGFYVYRLDRLITYGGYLGIGRLQDEHTKLARITIELDNNTDNDWLLDVTKSSITPPLHTQDQLKQVARSVCSKAASRYRNRVKSFCATCAQRPCQCPRAPQFELVWNCPNLVDEKGEFKVNDKHSMIKQFKNTLDEEQKNKFNQIIRLISKTIPVVFIRGIPSNQESSFVNHFDDRKESIALVRGLIEFAVAGRLSAGELLPAIQKSLLFIEPFSEYPDLIDKVIAEQTKRRTSE